MIRWAFEMGPKVAGDLEVIVVNDGSVDGTAKVLDDLARRHSALKIVHHPKNRGYGAALLTGFSHVSKEWLFYTDGDGQYRLDELSDLVKEIGPNVGLVNGYKISRSDSWYRTVIGKVYHFAIRSLFRVRILDTDCDYRLIRTRLLRNLDLQMTSGAICVELVRKIQATDFEIREVPVRHYPRLAGESQFFSLSHISKSLSHLPVLWVKLVLAPLLNRTLKALSATLRPSWKH
jgi:glycosyltransferase involved in cell wall biosynthesis